MFILRLLIRPLEYLVDDSLRAPAHSWFVLQHGVLRYYKTPIHTGKEPCLGYINVGMVGGGGRGRGGGSSAAQLDPKSSTAFSTKTKDRVFNCIAVDDADGAAWMAALRASAMVVVADTGTCADGAAVT